MSDFQTLLISDARISNITDKEHFAVLDGASQSTYQNFTASTQSSTSIVFNLQIPSENIVIDRHLLIQSTVTLTLKLANALVTKDTLIFDYGMTDALQAFPLNSLCTTQQMTINNCTVSQNTKDILPMILRLYDRRKLNRYNSLCPSLPDSFYANYSDGVGCINNVLSGYNNGSLDEDFQPRGAFPITIVNVKHVYSNTANGALEPPDDSLVQVAGTFNNAWEIVLTFTTTEPFIALSPWTNTNSNNIAGLVGVNNISCILNIDSTCKRVFSSVNNYIQSISLGASYTPTGGTLTQLQPFASTELLFNFLSLQPEQYKKISSKNCVPYLDFPRYTNSNASTTAIAAGASDTIQSNSIQLNQIPDLILICARKPMADQNWNDVSGFLTITGIDLSFNNTAGILSSASQQQLYNISYRNGSAQSFYEFSGSAYSNYTGSVDKDGNVTFNYGITGQGKSIATLGSMLVLQPVLDFCLPSFLSSSSLGQYNINFRLKVTNQFSSAITPELCIVTINSGIFTTQLGTSIINTGILTKEDVLRAKEEKPTMDTTDYKRYVGGSLMNMGSTNIMKLFRNHVMPSDDKTNTEDYNTASGLSAGSLSGGSSRISKLKKYMRN